MRASIDSTTAALSISAPPTLRPTCVDAVKTERPNARIMMTQEMLSHILGVRREGVTEAAGRLLKLGVIEYTRGRITVRDRSMLEKLSCECYAVVKKETDRLVAIHHGL